MTTAVAARVAGRSLVSDELFGRLVSFLVEDEGLTKCRAERVMDQALAFLGASAANPGQRMSPSRDVDPGWHAFVLHTADYAEWCQRVAGRFIHHRPIANVRARDGITIRRAVDAIEDAGYVVDRELWGKSADCDPNPPACDGDDGRPY
jgi:hypothetical protein